MSCLGVLFALESSDVERLLAAHQSADGDAAIMSVIEEIEESWSRDWLEETDKAWDAIHRCLTDGKLEFENGEYPLNLCILGGALLYNGDDYIVSLKTAEQVADIATALQKIDEATLRERYFKIDAETYDADVNEEDFGYTWACFQSLPTFYEKAAAAKRSVIFTVDQ